MPRNSNNSRKAGSLIDDNLSSDDMGGLSEEGKLILSNIIEKLNTAVAQILSRYDEQSVKVDQLELQVSKLKRENSEMMNRMDELEADQRDSSLIISGKSVPGYVNGENVSSVARDLLKSKLNYELPLTSITSAQRLGRKPASQASDVRPILLKLQHHSIKYDLRRAARTVKPANIFINDNLVPRRAKILRVLRAAKKKFPNKISACGSYNGRVFVWLTAASDTSKNLKVFVNTDDKLEDVCVKTLGIQQSDLDIQL